MATEHEQSPIKQTISGFEKVSSGRWLLPRLYTWRYRLMVTREVALADLEGCNRIVNVGCGSIPATAINLARLTGAEVVCLDFDSDAVSNARQVIGRFDYDEQISVREADGRTAPLDEFDAALVALHTVGKSAVLENFIESATPSDRAIVRYPRRLLRAHYGQPDEGFEEADSISQIGMNLDRSVLFVSD